MSTDAWAEWEPGPEEDEEEGVGGWTPPDIADEEDWPDGPDEEEITEDDRPAKFARISSEAKPSLSPAKIEVTQRQAAKLSDPWAVLHVPTGSPTGSNEQAEQPQAEKQDDGASRKRVAGKLTGWTNAEQVVQAMAAIGMEGKITKKEDIRTRIEEPTHFKGLKPRYVVYHYPTTRAVLCQGKLADDVRARLADWQAGLGSQRSARWGAVQSPHSKAARGAARAVEQAGALDREKGRDKGRGQ